MTNPIRVFPPNQVPAPLPQSGSSEKKKNSPKVSHQYTATIHQEPLAPLGFTDDHSYIIYDHSGRAVWQEFPSRVERITRFTGCTDRVRHTALLSSSPTSSIYGSVDERVFDFSESAPLIDRHVLLKWYRAENGFS